MMKSILTWVVLASWQCRGLLASAFHATSVDTISSNSRMESESYLHTLTKKVSIAANIPIFEFGQEITRIVTMAEDENGFVDPSTIIDLELVFYDYMAKLRSYYFLVFISYRRNAIADGILPDRLGLSEERDNCLGQCRQAMQAALPATALGQLWSFQGPLLELESDIDSVIEDALINLPEFDDNDAIATSPKAKRRSLLFQKIWKRLRWVSVQLALLTFNFAQTEWNRRSSKHLADRRLAEVPEFPLL